MFFFVKPWLQSKQDEIDTGLWLAQFVCILGGEESFFFLTKYLWEKSSSSKNFVVVGKRKSKENMKEEKPSFF